MDAKSRRILAKNILKSTVVSEVLTGKPNLIRNDRDKKTDYYQSYNRLVEKVEDWIEEENIKY